MNFDTQVAAMFFGRRVLERAARGDPRLAGLPGGLIDQIDPATEAALKALDLERVTQRLGDAFADLRHKLETDQSDLRADVERACQEAAFLDDNGDGAGYGTTGGFFHSDATANVAFNILLALVVSGVIAGINVEHRQEADGSGASRVETEVSFDGGKGLQTLSALLDVNAVAGLIERLMAAGGAHVVEQSRTPVPRAGDNRSD